MAENFLESPKVKKALPWVIGGVVLVLVYYYYTSSSSTASAGTAPGIDPATGVPYSTEEQQNAAAAQQSFQDQLASQTESDQANTAAATLQAQVDATNQQNAIAALSAAGGTISSVIQAQDAIPVAAINAASAENQTALTGAAAVAASANNAVPGILAASYAPMEQYGAAEANSGSVQAVNSFAQGVSTSEQASASVANAAQAGFTSRSNSNNALLTEVGTVAAIAAI